MAKLKEPEYHSYLIPRIRVTQKQICPRKTSDTVHKYHLSLDNTKPFMVQFPSLSDQLRLHKGNYDFTGVMNYSLDLRQLLNYCSKERIKKEYFKTIDQKYYCKAFVVIDFGGGDKQDLREFFYRESGFSITYTGASSSASDQPQTIQYVRYKRTASGARKGTCLFIAKELYDMMMTWSYAGLDPAAAEKKEPVSWEAYLALTLSSLEATMKVDPRQILFVKDYYSPLDGDRLNEIYDKNGELHSRRRQTSKSGRPNAVSLSNCIWDGEGLIDASLFETDETLRTMYADKHMLLLRGKFFKACVFKTNIQKWFRDNGITDETHTVKDLNGYTQSKKIADIRYIIPESCLKFLKFNDSQNTEDMIREWINNIGSKNNKPVWGIIKADKPSKFMDGNMVFTSYQMLNTIGFDADSAKAFLEPTMTLLENMSLPGSTGAAYVKYYLDHFYSGEISDADIFGKSDDTSSESDNNTMFRMIHYRIETARKLLALTPDFWETAMYKSVVQSLQNHIVCQIPQGRVLINGIYGTLFCNGLELLKYAIDKNYKPGDPILLKKDGDAYTLPVLRGNEIYSTRFCKDEQLVCARNPHITMGNYFLATNREYKIKSTDEQTVYDTYFDLSREIVCVNAIDSNIMATLNGCDFDSDTMLITNNPVMLDLVTLQSRRFRPPVLQLDATPIIREEGVTPSMFWASIDNMLSNSQLERIVNLSQRLNSLLWMLSPLSSWKDEGVFKNYNVWYGNSKKDDNSKKGDNKVIKIGQELYEYGCCTMAALSNIAIDSAKRTYGYNIHHECSRIFNTILKIGDSQSDPENLTPYQRLKRCTPWFDARYSRQWEGILPDIPEGVRLAGREILGWDPMSYLIRVVYDHHRSLKDTSEPSEDTCKGSGYFDFMKKLLNTCHISNADVDCHSSLNSCLYALSRCNTYISWARTNHVKDYAEECKQITKCCNSINNTLRSDTVNADALLWQLIYLFRNDYKLCKLQEPDNSTQYCIVHKKNNHYASLPALTRPKALLFAALFLNENTYLVERLLHSYKKNGIEPPEYPAIKVYGYSVEV